MTPRILPVPFADDVLAHTADALLGGLPGAGDGDLSGGLVLLPSARSCRDLAHLLLELSGRQALLLPRILTPSQWSDEVGIGGGLTDTDLPDDRVRAVLLGHAMADCDWLMGGQGATPGLAADYVAFFDEVRLHRVAGILLDDGDAETVVERVAPAEAEVVGADLQRIREVWGRYRVVVARDRVDGLVDLAAALEEGTITPALSADLVLVAGFGRVDPVTAVILKAALARSGAGRLLVPEIAAPLDRLLAATWDGPESGLDPMAPTRRLLRMLGSGTTDAPAATNPPLRERLAEVRAELDKRPTAPAFLVADNAEEEARAVAAHVAGWLAEHGSPSRGVTVATADPQLAARITARLQDAGLDADNTVGAPLASLPAGLLARFLLRAALTGLRAEPLLDVLSHGDARLTGPGAAPGVWALRLERMFRRETGPQRGLTGWLRRAREHDAAAVALFERQATGMLSYVQHIGDAFAPLMEGTGATPRPWRIWLDALAASWAQVAPDRPLVEDTGRPDVTALVRLLAALRRDAHRLPPVTLAAFTADLGRLLGGEQVASHRPQGIPVVVTGLVEARLARSDLLILAGLNEGVFPSATGTPTVLAAPARRALGLPTWREPRARDAELFLRLLHGAPAVGVSWAKSRDGQEALPSGFVRRLQLALEADTPVPEPAADWRRTASPREAMAAAQGAFIAEPEAAPRHALARPLTSLSWSALRLWRDCPYRSLLERSFALRAEEDVREEFGALEYGNLVHEILRVALLPGHGVHRHLADGQPAAALHGLVEVARELFLAGADDLPARRLHLNRFVALAPAIVDQELGRFPAWRPLAGEADFTLALPDVAAFAGMDPLPDHGAEVVLRGRVDRIDRSLEQPGALTVLDYKTGVPTPFDRIADGDDLQLALYALAVELGAVPEVTGSVTAATLFKVRDDDVGFVQKRGAWPLERPPGQDADPLVDHARALVELAVAASDPGAEHPLLPRLVRGEPHAKLPCGTCELRGVCRVEERDLGPAVRRQLDGVVNRKEVT